METLTTIIGVLVGIAVGLAIGWLMASARAQKNVQEVREQIQAEREQRLTAETRLQEMEKQLEAQKGLLDEARTQLSDTFKALSSDALQANSQAFVERAKETLEPLQQALRRYEDHLRELEQTRQRAYGKLDEQLRQLAEAEHQLQRETGNLVSALRRPQVRGRWGELTLRRVVEIAGMADHVDYAEQVSADTDQGRLRPSRRRTRRAGNPSWRSTRSSCGNTSACSPPNPIGSSSSPPRSSWCCSCRGSPSSTPPAMWITR